MKKIISTVTNDLTYDQRMIRICGSLARAGFEVTLVGRVLPNSKPIENQPFAQKRFRLFFTKGKLFYLEHNLRLFFFLLFARFDVVNSVDLDTLLPGYLVAKIKGKRCVFDAHEYFSEVPEVVQRPLVKKAWEALASRVIPRLKHCYTVGGGLAAIFSEKYGVPFSVIRNMPLRKPGLPVFPKKNEAPFFVLYQGVLNEGRGLEETLEAMPSLPGVELWLAGEGDLSKKLREMAAEMSLEGQVKFLGKISPAELPTLTSQADLGLNLLKNKGLNYYYSLANKAFDYVQAGIPSLGMNFPEYAALNAEQEVFLLLDELSPAAIAAAILRLKMEKELFERLAANCRRAREEWIWENEERKLLEIYARPVAAGFNPPSKQ